MALTIRDREPFTPTLLWNLLLRYAFGACFLVFAITANLRLMWVAAGVGVIAFVVARVGNRGRQDFGSGSRL